MVYVSGNGMSVRCGARILALRNSLLSSFLPCTVYVVFYGVASIATKG